MKTEVVVRTYCEECGEEVAREVCKPLPAEVSDSIRWQFEDHGDEKGCPSCRDNYGGKGNVG